jgi:hypothetical protein
MMCSARLIRRLPARESRWRCCWPEEASRGAVPFQEANRSRLANRRGVGDVGGQPAYRQPSAGATWVRMLSMAWAL